MRKEDICIRIPSEVEAKMLHRLLTEAREDLSTPDRISSGGNTYYEYIDLLGCWGKMFVDTHKQEITIYQLRELLGLAPQMGRRPKYAEPTKCVSFKVPVSKIDAIKALVREELAKVEIKKENKS